MSEFYSLQVRLRTYMTNTVIEFWSKDDDVMADREFTIKNSWNLYVLPSTAFPS